MNHKGQTLVVFVIIIPIFIFLLAFVCDTGFIYKEKTRLQSTLKSSLKNTYEKYGFNDIENKLKVLLEKNNIPVNDLKIYNENSFIIIENKYGMESIFGRIIGIKNYNIQVKLKVYEENDQLIIKKE